MWVVKIVQPDIKAPAVLYQGLHHKISTLKVTITKGTDVTQ
jgi:hypothetical protein